MKLLCLLYLLSIPGLPAFANGAQARVHATKADLAMFEAALDGFRLDCGRYPSTSEGLAALLQCPTNVPSARWHGPYLHKLLIDPWGNDYIYVCPGIHNTKAFDLYSHGANEYSRSLGSDRDDITEESLGLTTNGNSV